MPISQAVSADSPKLKSQAVSAKKSQAVRAKSFKLWVLKSVSATGVELAVSAVISSCECLLSIQVMPDSDLHN